MCSSRHVSLRCDELDRLSPLTFAISTAFDSLAGPGVGSVVLNCRGVLQISYRYVIQALTRSLRPLFPIL